jgi:GNAT superfamily N-acetyltransferase
MNSWQVRPAVSTDIHALIAFDHGEQTRYVWQMHWQTSRDGLEMQAIFRRVRLPREVWLVYPRSPEKLVDTWNRQALTLVVARQKQPGGYLRVERRGEIAWVTDLVVNTPWRRQGLALQLLEEAVRWAHGEGLRQITLEMLAKNDPAVQMAQKAGLDFCGYHDRYYPSGDVTLFYGKVLK